jgi:hypothetical protein
MNYRTIALVLFVSAAGACLTVELGQWLASHGRRQGAE